MAFDENRACHSPERATRARKANIRRVRNGAKMLRSLIRFATFAIASALSLAACESGGGPLTVHAVPSSVTIGVGESRTVAVAAGGILVNVTMPPAVAGNGSVKIAASTTGPDMFGLTGGTSLVTPPGTPLVYLTLTTNGTATYDSFPTPEFSLPTAAAASESFDLLYTSPSYELVNIAGPTAASGGSDIDFSSETFHDVYLPATSSSTPLLPLALTAGNTFTFALYEVPATS